MSTPIATGQTIPDFTLQTQDRAEWKLSDAVKQGEVVLAFFPFAFTGVCGTENQCISREMAAWQKKGAQMVGISCDSAFVLKAWAAAEGFKHTLLSDQHRVVCKSLGIWWPEMNTNHRATVIIAKHPEGVAKVKWVQVRQPKDGMKWDEVLAHVA